MILVPTRQSQRPITNLLRSRLASLLPRSQPSSFSSSQSSSIGTERPRRPWPGSRPTLSSASSTRRTKMILPDLEHFHQNGTAICPNPLRPLNPSRRGSQRASPALSSSTRLACSSSPTAMPLSSPRSIRPGKARQARRKVFGNMAMVQGP